MAENYKLIQGKTATEFEKRVNAALSGGYSMYEGYALLGGVHTQVVVKDEGVPHGGIKVVQFFEDVPYALKPEDAGKLVILECDQPRSVQLHLGRLGSAGRYPKAYRVALVGENCSIAAKAIDGARTAGNAPSMDIYDGLIDLVLVGETWVINGNKQ